MFTHSIEYRKLKKIGIYYRECGATFDFEYCEKCEYVILVDKLIRHVICNNVNVYFKISYRNSSFIKCTYDKNDPSTNICRGLLHLKDI